jgi:NADPH:quinone reductase-like Zn-dependent oxidoreductase
VFADGDVDGQVILITGGAGRVGHYAIQWASQAGATVVASASTPADAEACLRAGATSIVNHRSEQFAESILDATEGNPVDRVIDVEFGANLATSVKVLRVGGTIATYSSTMVTEPKLPFLEMMYKDLTIRMIIVYAMPESAKQLAISDLEKALGNDQLQHRIAQVLPLGEIVKGNELIEQADVRGSVVLTID